LRFDVGASVPLVLGHHLNVSATFQSSQTEEPLKKEHERGARAHMAPQGPDGFRVVVQFEIPKSACHSEAGYYRARNLLFRCWQQADSSPIKLARNDKGRSRGKLHHYRIPIELAKPAKFCKNNGLSQPA